MVVVSFYGRVLCLYHKPSVNNKVTVRFGVMLLSALNLVFPSTWFCTLASKLALYPQYHVPAIEPHPLNKSLRLILVAVEVSPSSS